MLPPNLHTLLEVALRTGVIYLLVLVGIRISGKREVGQMTPFDLTLLLLISNSVQNAMTGPDTSLAGGMVAATVLLILNYLVAELSGANRRFRKFIQGQPSLLVHDGEIITSHMAKEHVSMDELERSLREHGVATAKDVALAVLEVGVLLALAPVLAAIAGLAIGPGVVRPMNLNPDRLQQTAEMLQRTSATKEDFEVRAADGAVLSGWKIRPPDPDERLCRCSNTKLRCL